MKLEITGTAELSGKLKRNANLNDVKNAVKLNGSELQNVMMRKATFTKGYQTGATKQSINYKPMDNGYTVRVRPETHYSMYLEKGTRKMSAQPFVYPAFLVQRTKFINDLKRLMK